MFLYAVLNFVDFAICILLSVIVWSKGNARSIVSPFFCWIIAVGLWSFGVGMHTLSDLANQSEQAIFWSRFLHVGAVSLPVFYTHFVMALCKRVNRRILSVIYAMTLLLLLSIPTKFFITEVSPIYVFNLFPKAGFLYPVYLGMFSGCVLYSFYMLIQHSRESEGIVRNQVFYVLMGSAIGYTLGSTAFLPMFNVNVFPFGTPFVILNGVLITYAMIRYRAMDLSLVMRWGIAYGSSVMAIILFFLTSFYFIERFVTSYSTVSKGIATVLGICVATLFFDPLRKKVSGVIDRFIFKSPDYQSLLYGIERTLDKAMSIHGLTSELVTYLRSIWNVEHAGFVVWDFSMTNFQLYPVEAFATQSIQFNPEPLTKNDFLIRTLESERRLFKYGVVVDDELASLINKASPGEKVTFQKIRRTMRWVGAAACVPLMLGDQLIGFIVLGVKKNHALYNEEDKKFLSHVADKVSLSIKDLFLSDKIPNLTVSHPYPEPG